MGGLSVQTEGFSNVREMFQKCVNKPECGLRYCGYSSALEVTWPNSPETVGLNVWKNCNRSAEGKLTIRRNLITALKPCQLTVVSVLVWSWPPFFFPLYPTFFKNDLHAQLHCCIWCSWFICVTRERAVFLFLSFSPFFFLLSRAGTKRALTGRGGRAIPRCSAPAQFPP